MCGNLVRFVPVNWFKKMFSWGRRNLKFSLSDPFNFEEVWSFTSNRLRVFSLLFIVLILLSTGISWILLTSTDYFQSDEVSIDRAQLEAQHAEITALSSKLEAQENYIRKIKRILSGEVPVDTPLDSIDLEIQLIHPDSLHIAESLEEKELAKKVKADMMTVVEQTKSITYFGSPVVGVISQKFDKVNHPAVDIVTEPDMAVKACLPGTVIYSGFSRKDGYLLIIDHSNKYISVYKHNQRVLKKAGTKVKLGDPIAIVGNSGENTDGPHLHFELWYDQVPVNPEDFIQFTR